MGELEGRWEELRGLVGGLIEYDILITGTEMIKGLILLKALRDILGLLLNGGESVAGLLVEPATIVALTLRTASETWSTIFSGRPLRTDSDRIES